MELVEMKKKFSRINSIQSSIRRNYTKYGSPVSSSISEKADLDRNNDGILAKPKMERTKTPSLAFITKVATTSIDQVDSVQRNLNIQMVIAAFGGILCTIISNELCYDNDTHVVESLHECDSGLIFSFIGWTLSLFHLWRLILLYRVKATVKSIRWHFPSKQHAFLNTNLKNRFLLEALIAIINPVPYLSDVWGLGLKLVIIQIVTRLYLIVRMVRDVSPVHQRRRLLGYDWNRLSLSGSRNNAPISNTTALKTYFFTSPATAVLVLFLVNMLWLSYGFYIVEREFYLPRDDSSDLEPFKATEGNIVDTTLYFPSYFSHFNNCVWFMIVTMTTLGYGDMVPSSWQGRVFASLDVLTGVLITSLIVGVVTRLLSPNIQEKNVIRWLRLIELELQESEAAARIIQRSWKMYRHNKKVDFWCVRPDIKLMARVAKERQTMLDEHDNESIQVLLTQVEHLNEQIYMLRLQIEKKLS